MGWTAPRTWVAGEIVTAALMNSAVRDNLLYIKGVGQVPTIQSGLTIDNTLGSERLLLPLLSTAECATVLNAEGEVAFDETTHQMKEYDGTAVRIVLSEADVDDTPVNGATTVPVSSNWAYDFQQALTTAGDVVYATAAGVWARLPIGTANQLLRTNAGATAPEWAAVESVTSTGTYTGNGGANRAIAHGLGTTPKKVTLQNADGSSAGWILGNPGTLICAWNATTHDLDTCTAMDATNFYVGGAAGTDPDSFNDNGIVHYWMAIG